MLQNLRDNLKGTVAVVVIAIFVVPLVLFGVEQLFVGSVGGTDAAEVNGEGINQRDLQREMVLEKGRLQQQLELEASSPRLQDENLRGPVLDRMIRQQALLQAATSGGMGASKDELWKQIAQIEAFQVDGQFDYSLFKERISYLYTPAEFLKVSARDFILGHLNAGVSQSSFVTPAELETMAGISHQQRTFYTIKIPRGDREEVTVTEEEIQEYYSQNSTQFLDPESVVVEYVELSLDQLAKTVDVSEDEVRAVYETEVTEFDADPRYTVAHILLEGEDGVEARVQEIQDKLAAGESFAKLAEDYSDDLGSKDRGGDLGELLEEAFPEEFVDAAKQLDEGDVSGPVETDAGTHFIKVTAIDNVDPPSFEERKDAIRRQLARQEAQQDFILKSEILDEKSFGANTLQPAADALGLQVKTSQRFTRRGGPGIAANDAVVDAAFGDDVLKQSYNSRVLNLEGDRAIVLRVKDHQPELVKPLDAVKPQIEQRLASQKLDQQLEQKAHELMARLGSGASFDSIAEEVGYESALHENVSRNSFEGSPAVLRKVFSLPRPASENSPVIEQAALPGEGGVVVVGLTSVEDGSLENLEEAQKQAIERQLSFQFSQAEMRAVEEAIVQAADVDRPE